jgi:pimeloyl-ACP methyl ester carboxylesterase
MTTSQNSLPTSDEQLRVKIGRTTDRGRRFIIHKKEATLPCDGTNFYEHQTWSGSSAISTSSDIRDMTATLPAPSSRLITHPNGQTTHIFDDNFTDPWKPHETIVIQHGFGRHGEFWYHWVPFLSRRYRVIRRDARGHGHSSSPQQGSGYDYSVDTIIDEIIDTLDQLKLPKVHFLGESTSGIVGEILAAKHPDRLHSLIICSSPTYLPEAALSLFSFGKSSWSAACRELGARGWGEELSKVPGTVSIPDPDYVKWWINQVGLSTGDGLAGYAEFLSKIDSRPYLKSITVPMLILAPARSAATKLEEQRSIEAQVPDAQLVVINGTGHEIYVEMAEECQEAVDRFLSTLLL